MTDTPKTPIPGYPGYYADPTGTIWTDTTNQHRSGLRPLNHKNQTIPYPIAVLYKPDGNKITKAIHRIMGITYLGVEETNRRQVVRHKDGNTHNNQLDNLEIGTHKQNMADKKVHTTQIQTLRDALEAAIAIIQGAEHTPERTAAIQAGSQHL